MKKVKIVFVGLLVIFGMMVVNAATKDTTPPVLKSISLKESNKTYNIGDKVYLNLNANDDISGLSYIRLSVDYVEWDEDTTESCAGDESVYDLDNNPYFIVRNCTGNGKYTINKITLVDNANNKATYTNDNENKTDQYLDFNLNYSVKTDRNNSNNPSLESINIDKEALTKNDNAVVKVLLGSDISNVESVFIWFVNKGKSYYVPLDLFYNEAEKAYIGSIPTPPYNGEYTLESVYITTKTGNSVVYVTNKNYDPEHYVEPVKFVVSGALDKLPNIQISKVDYTYRKLVAPNVYKIGIELTEGADLIYNARVLFGLKKDENKNFSEANDKFIEVFLTKDENNKLVGYADINQFNDIGVYYLADVYFNYSFGTDKSGDQLNSEIYKNLKFDKIDLFEIVEDNTYEVISSTTDKELIDKIKGASDNAKIAINSTSSSIVSKEVFDTIKGTNKTIYIESGGIQWVFNGNDIKEAKEIDTSVNFNYLYNDKINSKLSDVVSRGLVINFSDNGKLPGKALIRVKTDYALRDYLGIENLFVYHYINEDNILFNRVAKNISMTEDGYLEFYVDHNSTFVIASHEVDSKYVSDSVDDLALNDSTLSSTSKDKNILMYCILACVLVVLIFIFIVKSKKKKNINKELN